jgi:exonuclease III
MEPFKLISWNIACRMEARTRQLAWIASEKADILALQEVIRADDLQDRLFKLGFKYFESTKPTGGRKKLVAVASREPFDKISIFHVPHPERALSCKMSLKSKVIELHCVHVPPGEQYKGIKIKFLEGITKGISARKRPQVLVGDFNCPQFMEPMVTWAEELKNGAWEIQETCKGIAGKRWAAAERSILCPRKNMTDAFKFINGKAAPPTYVTKAKGGGNTFDHMILSKSIMPSTIRVATHALQVGLSDHAALVAECKI